MTPTNASGRIVGAFVMLEGIAFLAIVTAAITSTFVTRAEAQPDAAAQAEEDLADDRIDARLEGPGRADGPGRAAADQADRGVTGANR